MKENRVLIIDRGWLEKQSGYEIQFISYFRAKLSEIEHRMNGKMNIFFDIISIMDELNGGRIFDFIDNNEEKIKQLKWKFYKEIDTEYPDYTTRFSSDMIKDISDKILFINLHVFIVYTESDKEIEFLSKKYNCKTILKFDEEMKHFDDDYNRIYISSTQSAIKIAKAMPLYLFQDLKETHKFML